MVPTPRRHRAARGLAAASVATLGALVPHLAGGGPVPGPVGWAVPWVLSVFVCTAIGGRRLSLWRLSLGIGASQLLFHALFVLGTTPAAASPLPAHHAHMAAEMSASDMPGIGAMPGMVPTDPSMWIWHAVAAMVTIAAFHRGEVLLCGLQDLATRVAEWARTALVLILLVMVPANRPRLAAAARPVARLRPAPQRCPLQRRGPPRPFTV
ncbi:hypothetical protein SCMU_06650 [Sinomonas cyclohexanicum]|uniref:Integral membrane protein n=1 Tax=Sinomonas cyclohexanicum TaxID=322009 RepID=A0ABM7PRK3_SINCY|nr:hypothetical protein [Corynebacterium cyclohexanicum]BCT74823.1 hypothetical protein SCMU_06650 [Corynebacterium cyclohexanicum]